MNDVITKHLSEGNNLHSFEVSFFRFFFSTITLIPFMVYYGKASFTTSKPLVHFCRGLLLFFGIAMWCYGLQAVPLSVATIVSFTIPLFVLVLAAIFLKERASWQIWGATIVGFIGVVVILGPNDLKFQAMTLLLLGSAFMFAMLDIINKKFIIQETMLSMLFYSALVTTLLSFIPSMMVWKMPTLYQLTLLFILGAGANAILFCILKAFAKVDASTLAPFRYLELILSASFGLIIFNEIPFKSTIIGALIIIPSTLFVVWSENRRKNKQFLKEKLS
jgi:S-adenosylmethionine uptake transporter